MFYVVLTLGLIVQGVPKKCSHVCEAINSPKYGTRNESREIFEILRSSSLARKRGGNPKENKPLQGMAPTECLPSACQLSCLLACLPACLPATDNIPSSWAPVGAN